MRNFFQTILTTSFHGSIVILAVLLLRQLLRKAPKKYICTLWILAGIRLLLPIPVESAFSLQPGSLTIPIPSAWGRYLPFLWGTIAAGIGIYSVASYMHLRRQVFDAVKIPGGWESDRIDTAFVLGFIRPKIYIPTGMPSETRKQILAHERTHLDKGDQWIKMLGFVALALHWFNPLVWVSYICLCKDIEMACDERVIQFMELEERKEYSTALLRCSTNRVHYAACPVAFGEVSVKYRIQSILNYRKPSFWLSLLAVLAFLFVGVCLVTNPQNTVEVPVDADEALRQISAVSPEAFTPAVTPESPENPDWGLEIFADVGSTTGGNLVFCMDETFFKTSEFLKIADVTLEQWKDGAWKPLTSANGYGKLLGDYEIYFGSHREAKVEYNAQPLDWSLMHGALSDGDYRVSLKVTSQTSTATFYAPFHIYRKLLPSEQENALTRCGNALKALASSEAYQVCISATAPDGEVYPTRTITCASPQMRVDHYVGDMVVSSSRNENVSVSCENWQEPFTLDGNRQFLFPEGESVISEETISFCSVWADYTGTTFRGTDTYSFYDDGTLKSVRRLTQTLDAQGKVTDSRVALLESARGEDASFSEYIRELADYQTQDSFDEQYDSPWHIAFRVDDDLLSPTSAEVWLGQDNVGVSDYTTDGTYWLEKKVGVNWERLGGPEKYGSWSDETIRLTNKTAIRQADWSDTYGTLDAGIYRMGKRFFRGEESTIQYSEFAIYPSGGVYGQGAKEALTRVDAALSKVANGNYRVEKTVFRTAGYDRHSWMSEIYWKYGDTVVVDFYNDMEAYSHSVAQEPGGVYYNTWLKRSLYESDYDSIYFPAGYSLISDREIRLVFTLSSTSDQNPAILYTYRFDEDGDLWEIEEHMMGYNQTGLTYRYTITDTPEAEIQAWVEAKKAEQDNR